MFGGFRPHIMIETSTKLNHKLGIKIQSARVSERCRKVLNAFTPRVSYRDIKVILTPDSVDEILWCDHSNETSSAVLSHGTIYIYVFTK